MHPQHLHEDADAEDIGVGEARAGGKQVDDMVLAQRQRVGNAARVGRGRGVGERAGQGAQRGEQRRLVRPSIPAREQPADQRLRDHRHAEEGFGRLSDQEDMAREAGERRGRGLRDGHGDAGLVLQELRRGHRLGRRARLRAEHDQRARIEPWRVLRHELGGEMPPHLERRAEALDPILQAAHRAVGRAAGQEDDAVDARRDLAPERHRAGQRVERGLEVGHEPRAVEGGGDEAWRSACGDHARGRHAARAHASSGA